MVEIVRTFLLTDGRAALVQREDGSGCWDGMLPVDEFFEILTWKSYENRGNYQTLGGSSNVPGR